MGVCLSCLGLRRHDHDNADRTRLLYDDYPGAHNYGTWGAGTIPPQNVVSPEELQREQEALDRITRWASDQIVEIFPSQHRSLAMPTSQLNGTHLTNTTGEINAAPSTSSTAHQDILLSLIPGDKSKRSIRIYPASRPSSKDAQSLRSKTSIAAGLNGTGRAKESSVLVTLDVDLP